MDPFAVSPLAAAVTDPDEETDPPAGVRDPREEVVVVLEEENPHSPAI